MSFGSSLRVAGVSGIQLDTHPNKLRMNEIILSDFGATVLSSDLGESGDSVRQPRDNDEDDRVRQPRDNDEYRVRGHFERANVGDPL
jgi:hypothetical protein